MSASHLVATPGQTVGPFFGFALPYAGGEQLVPSGHPGAIRLTGRVLDGHGHPVPDAMIEIWQADAQGRYANPRDNRALPNAKFKGFGRSATNKEGVFGFETIKPGAVPGPGGKPQAPHIVFCIYSRGMLRQIYTRMYFPDEAANAADPILNLVPTDRRQTLIARKDGANYRFDIRVQGDNETVFFDI